MSRVSRTGFVAVLMLPALLYRLSERAQPEQDVVVHVEEGDVELIVGGTYRRILEKPSEPLLFSLRPGRYELILARGATILHRSEFEVPSDRPVVLAPLDESKRSDDDTRDADPSNPRPHRKSTLIEEGPETGK